MLCVFFLHQSPELTSQGVCLHVCHPHFWLQPLDFLWETVLPALSILGLSVWLTHPPNSKAAQIASQSRETWSWNVPQNSWEGKLFPVGLMMSARSSWRPYHSLVSGSWGFVSAHAEVSASPKGEKAEGEADTNNSW